MSDLPDPPAAPPAPAVPPDPPARRPEWFHALDVAAAAVAVAAAFLTASFAARNSPLFLHLAGGRALVQGKLTPGADPFTHAGAAGRPWADTHWLFDLGAYALYSADPSGAALVAVKALGVAAGLGLLVLLRRAGDPLWPWVLGLLLALVAAADQVPAASVTASVPLLAATVVLLFRLDWSRPGWRNPLVLGGLTAVWANLDGWSLLGPVCALGVWAGRGRAAGRRLGWGVLFAFTGLLLNPFVLAALLKSPADAAWQLLPRELGLHLPAEAADDGAFRNLRLGPLSPVLTDRVAKGDDLNLPALGLLAVLGLAGAVLGRSPAAGLLAALGLGVGLTNFRLAPFAAVLLVPAAGLGLTRLAGRVRPGRAGDPAARILLTLGGLGRGLLLLAAGGAGVAAYPGWLHPPGTDPAYGKLYNKPAEWAVDPDPGLARTAALLPGLPADRPGLAVGPDLADYATWFAPGVRQFVTTRYGFHRADLPDLLLLRAATLGRRGLPTTPEDVAEAGAACDRRGGGYMVVTAGAGQRVDDSNLVAGAVPAVYAFALRPDRAWTLWHLDGRAVVLGRGPGGPAFDPAAVAFGPGRPLPPGPTGPVPLPPADDSAVAALEQLRNPVRPPPMEADDVLALAQHLGVVRQVGDAGQGAAAGLGGGPGLVLAAVGLRPAPAELGLPVLAVRAARLAVAAAPDRPEPYRALQVAYELPAVPLADDGGGPVAALFGVPEADAQQLTAAARFLARLPADPRSDDLRRAGLITATQQADRLARQGQLDLARGCLEQALRLLPAAGPTGGKESPLAAERKRLEELAEQLSGAIGQRLRAATQQADPGRQVMALFQSGLPGKGLDLFKKAADAGQAFGPSALALAVVAAEAELRAGRLEDAVADLAALDDALKAAPDPPAELVARVRAFRDVASRLAGDPRAALAGQPQTPLAPPAAQVREVLAAPQTGVTFGAAAGGPAGAVRISGLLAQAQGVVVQVQAEATRQADRGLLAVLDGDPTEAARRLDAAQNPLGLPLAEFSPPLADRLRRYRELVRVHGGK